MKRVIKSNFFVYGSVSICNELSTSVWQPKIGGSYERELQTT